jgi:hypothetical protein
VTAFLFLRQPAVGSGECAASPRVSRAISSPLAPSKPLSPINKLNLGVARFARSGTDLTSGDWWKILGFGPGRKTRCRILGNFGRFSGLTAADVNLVYPSSESRQLEWLRSTRCCHSKIRKADV